MRNLSTALLLCLFFFTQSLVAQPSIAREWNEAVLQVFGEDLVRPAVQARNMFHLSLALYDSWAAYDPEAEPYLLGKTVEGYNGGYSCPCKDFPVPEDMEAARREAMSFAAYRLMAARFSLSPVGNGALTRFRGIMEKHGYDFQDQSIDYASGSPAALGNYVAQCILQMSQLDGANDKNNYPSAFYQPANPPLDIALPGAQTLADPNHWQPLNLNIPIDLDGHRMQECRCGGKPLIEYLGSVDPMGRTIVSTQTYQCAGWGRVQPFALTRQDLRIHQRNGYQYWVYHDPGAGFLPKLDTSKGGGSSADYAWNFALVAAWSAFHDPSDGVLWDVSPRSTGNIQGYPQNRSELPAFFNLETGRDAGTGHDINPRTGQPYGPQMVPRGDFTRAAVGYWNEGPNRETVAGHWFTLLNYLSDQPGLVKKFNGKGRVLDDLEWDVKAYFILGAALHDAAIATWSIKGRYNSIRPISALRHLAALGQSTSPKLPAYHPAGLPLLPGHIELVGDTDPLAGAQKEHVDKIKFYAWEGPFAAADTAGEAAGTGWILAENWFPYQSKEFITPPYSGYVSEHSAFSHAAASVLTLLTGDAYFPRGLGAVTVTAGSDFLQPGQGPATDVVLQWATYRDAADQASLSRIWAGTNPPFDDIPGRRIGEKVGTAAFQLARTFLYQDRDGDGYFSYEDCDDTNPLANPGAPEECGKRP